MKHPHADHIMDQQERIAEEGILVEEVTSMPVCGKPYASPNYVICINHRGTVDVEYDTHPMVFRPHAVSVVFPNHVLLTHESSPDYKATAIIVSPPVFSFVSVHVVFLSRFEYEQQPDFPLSDEQYHDIMTIVESLKTISRHDTPIRMELLQNQLLTLLVLLNSFRRAHFGMIPSARNHKTISHRFYEALVEHSSIHRDVAFYADLFSLTPKYFGEMVHKETGRTASHWIRYHVVIRAKTLMLNQPNSTLQQISDQLGFTEQSNFSRYFKRETGMSPDEWRQQQL